MIGSLLVTYNSEMFIKPHLDMLKKGVDKVVVLLSSRPYRTYATWLGMTPDRTEKIIRKYFPKVEIVKYDFEENSDDATFFPKARNFGMQKLRDCDVVTHLDADMILTDEEFKEFVDILRNDEADYFMVDWSKYSPNYYGAWDLDHGLMNQVEVAPMAVRSYVEFTPYFRPEGKTTNIEGINFHHLRNWKGSLVPKGDFVSAPKEIKKKMLNWREQLKYE